MIPVILPDKYSQHSKILAFPYYPQYKTFHAAHKNCIKMQTFLFQHTIFTNQNFDMTCKID